MAPPGKGRTYRAQEVCDLLELSKKTLYGLEASGEIPAVPRDWRNWRIYSERHLRAVKQYQASKKG